MSTLDMDYNQKITLSPLQKYILYNQFPYKLLLHTLLIIFTTYQVYSVVGQITAHNRAQHFVLKQVLLNSDSDSDQILYHNLQDFQDSMKNMIENLQNLDDVVIQNLDLSDAIYQMNIYYGEFDLENINQSSFKIHINEPIKEPFDLEDIASIKTFIQGVAMIEFIGNNIYNLVQFRDLKKDITCLNWNFNIQYNLQKIGVIDTKLYTTNSNCSGQKSQFGGQTFLIIHMIVLTLALISVVLTLQHIYELGSEYLHHKSVYKEIHQIMGQQSKAQSEAPSIQPSPNLNPDQHEQFKLTWKEVKDNQQVQSFDYWFIVSGIGGFFQIVGSLIAIFNALLRTDLSIFKMSNTMMGLGCFFAWVLSLKYLEYIQEISLMTGTLKQSSRNVLMFLIGILPFFFGFVFLAQSIFWKYDNFSTSLDSILTLFALSNGDIVLDSFSTTWPSGIFGQVFLTVFMVLFFTAVQNVLVTIIMEGYEKIAKVQKEQQLQAQNINDDISQNIELEKSEAIQKRKQLEFDQDDEKELFIAKLNLSHKRVERMLGELDQITDEIDQAHINTMRSYI